MQSLAVFAFLANNKINICSCSFIHCEGSGRDNEFVWGVAQELRHAECVFVQPPTPFVTLDDIIVSEGFINVVKNRKMRQHPPHRGNTYNMCDVIT